MRNAPRMVPYNVRAGHQGSLVSRHGTIVQSAYSTPMRKSWSIQMQDNDEQENSMEISSSSSRRGDVVVRLEWMQMERVMDTVRIYEHYDGSGALVAVWHGDMMMNNNNNNDNNDKKNDDPMMASRWSITMNNVTGCYVVFSAHRNTQGGKGFKLNYQIM